MSVEYQIEDQGPTEKTIRVQIGPDRVDQTLRDHFLKYRSQLRLPGFRPGRIPMDLLERDYGEAIREEARWALVNETSRRILEDNKIEPFTPPKSDPPAIKGGEAFAFDLKVETRPLIGEVKYKGLSLQKETPQVSDFELNEELDKLRKTHATLRAVEDRPPRAGDIIVIDLDGLLEGKAFKGGTGQDIQAELGSGFFDARFEQEIQGTKRGETREFDFTFGPEHWDRVVAGKTVRFTLKLKEVKEKVLAEMDDDFAQTYLNQANLSALQAVLREKLMARAEERARRKMRSELIRQLVQDNPIDVPKSLLDLHSRRLANAFMRDATASGHSAEDAGKMLESRSAEIAEAGERESRAMLLMEQVAKVEKVNLERKDVESYFQRISSLSQTSLDVVRRYYTDEQRAKELAASLVEEKILDLMMSHAIIQG